MRISFDEYIRKIPALTLFKHVLKGQKKGVLSENVYESIIADFNSETTIPQIISELSEPEKLLLCSIYLSGNNGYIAADSKEVNHLLSTFLVYESIDQKGNKCLQGFCDFDDLLAPLFAQLLTHKNTPPVLVPLFHPILDLLAIIDAIRFGKIVLKQTGEISKGSVDAIFSSTGLSGLLLPFELQTKMLEQILALLHVRGEIILQGQTYHLTPQGMKFCQQSTSAQNIFSEFESLLDSGNLNIILSMIGDDGSVCFGPLLENNNSLSISIAILRWFNFISEQEGQCYSIVSVTADPPRVTSGHIMPDFTLFIPPEIEPEAFFKILSVSVLERVDMIYHARLDRQKVVSSLAMGIDLHEILSILQQWHAAESICHTVQEWGTSFQQLYIDKGTFLAVSHNEVDTVNGLTEIQDYLEETTAYTIYKIRDNSEGIVKKHLLDRGYDLRKPELPSSVISSEVGNKIQKNANIPNFTPQIDMQDSSSQGRVGRYGGTPRRLSVEEIQKVVRYAQLMDEWLMIFIKDHEQPVSILPKQLRSGDNGAIEGVDSDDEIHHIEFSAIDRMGVIPNE